MPRSVQLQDMAGEPLTAFDFGTVLPGTSSAITPLQLRNTGDVAVVVKVWVENASPADGTLSVSFGSASITAQDEASADILGTLAAGDALTGEASYVVPPLSEGVMQARSILKFKYG